VARGHAQRQPLRDAAADGRLLVWISRDGTEEALPIEPQPYTRATISPDGTRLALAIAGPDNRDVWVYEIARRTLMRLTLDPATDTAPIWSPDSRRIAFRSDRDGGGLFVMPADGAGPAERLTQPAEKGRPAHTPYSFTPDGGTVIYDRPGGGHRILPTSRLLRHVYLMIPAWLTTDIAYLALLFTLFVAPRFLQRFGIPSALTALGFGAAAGMGLGIPHGDEVVHLFATLGVVALFLFAGLDVEVGELRREARVLVEHVVVRALLLAPLALGVAALFDIDRRAAFLVTLALITPSTGFILDSIDGWGLSERERFWVRSTAIATELVALAVLFIVLQSTSLQRMGWSALAIVGMILVLPAIFRWFAKVVVPHAPKSEFGFLVMIATACALVTRSLGVYYLVGAFIVGMSAQRFRQSLPALSSERMLSAVEAFASLFVPFYFFHAGLELTTADFQLTALLTGLGFLVVIVPIRLLLVGGHRGLRLREALAQSLRVGVPLLPTTVFTLVLVEILRERFVVPPFLIGGLIVYMLVNTLAPSLILRKPTPAFEDELIEGARKAGERAQSAVG
jgi:Kef-type K+ transport system membrane component KefB